MNRPDSPKDAVRQRWRQALPLVFGVVLFALNQIALLVGYLAPPEGYVGTWLPRSGDFAQYLTWIDAYRCTGGWLLPDYHAPWTTEPALLNPFCWLIARLSLAANVDAVLVWHLFHLALYIATAYILVFAFHAFTHSLAEFRWALLTSVCAVPLVSMLTPPLLLLSKDSAFTSFLWKASMFDGGFTGDGFFNGILSSPVALVGTAMTLACMGLLACYLRTDTRSYLWAAAVIAALGALIHPFEVFAVAPAGCLALMARPGRSWARGLQDAACFGASAGAGVVPYVVLTLSHPWLRVAAERNRWIPSSVVWFLLMLGLPALSGVVTFFLPWRKASPADNLLRFWFGAVLVLTFVPWIPWSQHLLDGFHYATGLLLVRWVAGSAALQRLWNGSPIMIRAFLCVVVTLSVAAHGMYMMTAAAAGRVAGGESATVAPKSELAVLAWLKQHANPSELVLAPSADAGWFATIPMHSFASHWLFSLTWGKQLGLSYKFYRGTFDRTAADAFLREYGVRYAIVPDGSPAARYFPSPARGTHVGNVTIYEMPSFAMRPFSAAVVK